MGPTDDALLRLRRLMGVVQSRRSKGLPVDQLVSVARDLGGAVTIDFTASETLGHPLVVLRQEPTPGGQSAHFARLTPREREVAELLACGLRNKDIAELLGIAVGTVKDHVHSILEKSGLESRAQVAALWGSVD